MQTYADRLLDGCRGNVRLSTGVDIFENISDYMKYVMAMYAQAALHDTKVAEESRVILEEYMLTFGQQGK